jgi:hypothetical protein
MVRKNLLLFAPTHLASTIVERFSTALTQRADKSFRANGRRKHRLLQSCHPRSTGFPSSLTANSRQSEITAKS